MVLLILSPPIAIEGGDYHQQAKTSKQDQAQNASCGSPFGTLGLHQSCPAAVFSISSRYCDRGDYVSRMTDRGTEEHDRRVEADGGWPSIN